MWVLHKKVAKISIELLNIRTPINIIIGYILLASQCKYLIKCI